MTPDKARKRPLRRFVKKAFWLGLGLVLAVGGFWVYSRAVMRHVPISVVKVLKDQGYTPTVGSSGAFVVQVKEPGSAGTTVAPNTGPIAKLQDQFRKLGGTVTPIEGNAGSDYLFPGPAKMPYEVVEVLRALREAHLVRSAELKGDRWQLLSALLANRAGRDLLQFEREHTSLLDPVARRRVSSELRDFYDSEIDLGWLLSNANPREYLDDLFRSAELSRARDFMGSVYRRMDLGGSPAEGRALAQFEALVGYRVALAGVRGFSDTSDRGRQYLSVLLRSLDLRSRSITGGSLARFDDPRADSGVATASQVASLMGIGEALVMYHLTEVGAYAFVLTRNREPQMIKLPSSTQTLRERARAYHAQLSSEPLKRGGYVAPGSKPDAWRDTGYELYETLIRPLESYLGGADRVMIVPHDMLHLVPFAALPTTRSGRGAFLLDRYPTWVLPTPMFRGWSRMRRREPTKLAMVVGINEFTLARPLKHAEEEARNIARILGEEESDLLLGSRGQATYSGVADKMEDYSVVHIASHGAYIPSVPGASHVLLRGSPGQDDEPLMAVDILGMQLNASLIVLSACQTATAHQGGLPPDGDILGLPRSLLIAGAERVIASLWAVDDRSTREFFEYFYREALGDSLSRGPRKGDVWPSRSDLIRLRLANVDLDEAFARAQRRLRSEYPDPHFWAPFIMIGS